ncbi:mannitol dehydrogenase family protein [Psychromarinibacter sp. C21-152]|uniref:Mannitol dehydrogenase family protein n=1 Tax=Psychromarinibacter sediminicola TaxID=3033385 RepID=A0AAE3NVQ3_9RHOB|nr:mannitol dehydrogenase family protein [Psychromarinibacter sediminicola]MDF0603156.1 mannitol dehydrogenase family protein [Psychromarinibacter sediminicola]
MTTDIVQFGTSRFLQAHADLFFSESDPPRGVTVVQSSGDPVRARRLAALADPAGYPVRIRGLRGGHRIDETRTVTSVTRTLSTATEWTAVAKAVRDARMILSNTGDAGFDPRAADAGFGPPQSMSYPGKLRHLLRARFESGGDPLPIFPMELIRNNGQVLRERVLHLAVDDTVEFQDWLSRCQWTDSLVDRIVSEPIDPAGAVAEPYALWAIRQAPGLAAPADHPAIVLTDNLERFERLKLHILNLGHTVLAHRWREIGAPDGALVRDWIAGPEGERLMSLMQAEVLPGFAAAGMAEDAAEYLATTLERFANPFIDHRIADISENHAQKLQRRIGAFLEWVRKHDQGFAAPRLAAILSENG